MQLGQQCVWQVIVNAGNINLMLTLQAQLS